MKGLFFDCLPVFQLLCYVIMQLSDLSFKSKLDRGKPLWRFALHLTPGSHCQDLCELSIFSELFGFQDGPVWLQRCQGPGAGVNIFNTSMTWDHFDFEILIFQKVAPGYESVKKIFQENFE